MKLVGINEPLVKFHRILPSAKPPRRSHRAVGGIIPARASQYCEPICTASAFGYHLFPPMDFSLIWDGTDIIWKPDSADIWYNLNSVQLPDAYEAFNSACPAAIENHIPPVVAACDEPGIINLWSGLFARTKKNWSLLVRPPANLPRSSGYESYEGIVETDRWFGPLFTNIRLTKTDVPIEFRMDRPFVQVQPIFRDHYQESLLDNYEFIDDVSKLASSDWTDYERTIISPGLADDREPANYAKNTRRRRREGACKKDADFIA